MFDITAYKKQVEIEFMKAGFNMALNYLQDFWRKYSEGKIKESKLNNYKGINLIIKKIIENKDEFFIKGDEVFFIITQEEKESIKKIREIM